MDRDQMLDVTLQQIEKAHGKGAVMKMGEKGTMAIEAISTGALSLDLALGVGGLPRRIVVDNGPEFAGKALDAWAYSKGIELQFIQPGKPVENAYIESFNGRFRDECLSEHWFTSLSDARGTIERWRRDYNEVRPHGSLGYQTIFAAGLTLARAVAHRGELQMSGRHGDPFEREGLSGQTVMCAVDRAHTPFADLHSDLVSTKFLTSQHHLGSGHLSVIGIHRDRCQYDS